MPESLINWHLDIGTLITILVMVITYWRFTIQQEKSRALRDQKIDMVLFGIDGKSGLLGDVSKLQGDSSYMLECLSKYGFNRRSGEDDRRHAHS